MSGSSLGYCRGPNYCWYREVARSETSCDSVLCISNSTDLRSDREISQNEQHRERHDRSKKNTFVMSRAYGTCLCVQCACLHMKCVLLLDFDCKCDFIVSIVWWINVNTQQRQPVISHQTAWIDSISEKVNEIGMWRWTTRVKENARENATNRKKSTNIQEGEREIGETCNTRQYIGKLEPCKWNNDALEWKERGREKSPFDVHTVHTIHTT